MFVSIKLGLRIPWVYEKELPLIKILEIICKNYQIIKQLYVIRVYVVSQKMLIAWTQNGSL